MRYCAMDDCTPKTEERGGICCKYCPNKNDCHYACDGCEDDSVCVYELEDEMESN